MNIISTYPLRAYGLMGKKVKHIRNLCLEGIAYNRCLADPTYIIVGLANPGTRKTPTNVSFDLILAKSEYDYHVYYSAFELEVAKDDGAEVPAP